VHRADRPDDGRDAWSLALQPAGAASITFTVYCIECARPGVFIVHAWPDVTGKIEAVCGGASARGACAAGGL
jgi:hypothetical protein